MTTLKEESMAYESKATKNISELSQVDLSLEVVRDTFKDKDGKEINFKYIEIDLERYRVPDSVLKSLKAIIEEKPDLKTFKVKRSGSGLNTDYQVIPLE